MPFDLERERAVHLLDMDATVLRVLDAASDLDQLAGRRFGPTAGWHQRITSCLQDILVIGTAGGCQVGSVYLYYHGCPKTDAPGSRW